MTDSWKILSLLRDYYAPQGTDEELLPICEAASAELSSKIKDGADPDDIRLVGAAAAEVNYRLCTKNIFSENGISSFKAGDVSISVSGSESIEAAEKEKNSAYLKALPLLNDDGFFFGQVSV